MTIICGTDFSEGATTALDSAVALATRFGDTELWLTHALDPVSEKLDEDATRSLRSAAEKKLEEEAGRLRGGTGARVACAVMRGPASEALQTISEQKNARLLVVSSQGHAASPLRRLGGTSERIARSTKVPLLVVRDDARPFESWARGDRPLRVLLGVDDSASAEPAIRWVEALRRAGPCEVTVGHVYFPMEAFHRYGVPLALWDEEKEREVEAMLARDLGRRVGDMTGAGGVTIRPKLGLGRTGDHLLELGDDVRADLIVVGTHHPNALARLASVSSVVLHYSRAAVAIIPASEEDLRSSVARPRSLRCVLIATDLSAQSNAAIPDGYMLLSEGGGEVHLLHVASDRKSSPEFDAETAAHLRALVPAWAAERGIVTRTEIVHQRNVAGAVCEASERAGADVICVATHGGSEMRRAFLGSVAQAIVTQSRRPVLLAHAPRP